MTKFLSCSQTQQSLLSSWPITNVVEQLATVKGKYSFYFFYSVCISSDYSIACWVILLNPFVFAKCREKWRRAGFYLLYWWHYAIWSVDESKRPNWATIYLISLFLVLLLFCFLCYCLLSSLWSTHWSPFIIVYQRRRAKMDIP